MKYHMKSDMQFYLQTHSRLYFNKDMSNYNKTLDYLEMQLQVNSYIMYNLPEKTWQDLYSSLILRYFAILSACIWNFHQPFMHLRLYYQQQHKQKISDHIESTICWAAVWLMVYTKVTFPQNVSFPSCLYIHCKKFGYLGHLSCIPFLCVTCKVQEVLTIWSV